MSISSNDVGFSKACQIAELSFDKTISIEEHNRVCQYIEANREHWATQLNADPHLVLKQRKNKERCFSVYISRNQVTGNNQYFINLGKIAEIGRGAYKVVTEAIEYETLLVAGLAKTKLSEHYDLTEINPRLFDLADREAYILHRFPHVPELLQSLLTKDFQNSDGVSRRVYITPYSNIGDMLEDAPKDLTDAEKYLIILDVVKGLYEMHITEHVHQDIKPGNILLHDYNPSGQRCIRAKLGDFGFSKKIGVNDDQELATPLYTSPEKLQFNNDPALAKPSDIWSLGITSCEFFYNKHPCEYLYERYYSRNRKILSAQLKNYIDAIPEPQDTNSMGHFIWSMLRHAPEERITIETAYQKLLKMKPMYDTR